MDKEGLQRLSAFFFFLRRLAVVGFAMAHVPGDVEPHKRKRIEGADEGGGGSPGGGGSKPAARAGGFGQGAPQPPHFGTSLRSLAFSYVTSLRGYAFQNQMTPFPHPLPMMGGRAFTAVLSWTALSDVMVWPR